MFQRRALAVVLSIMLIAVLAGCEGDTGPAGPAGAAGQDGDTVVLGFASVDKDGNLLAWGGSATTSVGTTKAANPGAYNVTFTGNYPGVTGQDDVTFMVSSSNTQAFDVAAINHDSSTASTTEISVDLWTWSTDANPIVASDAAFSVMILKQ